MASTEDTSSTNKTKSFVAELKKIPEWKQELLLKRKNLNKTNVEIVEPHQTAGGVVTQNGLAGSTAESGGKR